MILALLTHLMIKADCQYHLRDRWHAFKERHIISDDPYDDEGKRKDDDDDETSD